MICVARSADEVEQHTAKPWSASKETTSDHLAARTVRVALPALDDDTGHAYSEAITTALTHALTSLPRARLAS
ncbi:hypothetical protein ACQEVF_57235 [Nonomuraea polychroma]|uniref:hypothetical protein n=1 Tax=Nonomuraea polychroma TaxID=46176 RepID=UPI003D9306AC